MRDDWWDRPVWVTAPHGVREVARPDQAADLLRNGWPEKASDAYRLATEAVSSSLKDPDSTSARQTARLAFEAAAREAGILDQRERPAES